VTVPGKGFNVLLFGAFAIRGGRFFVFFIGAFSGAPFRDFRLILSLTRGCSLRFFIQR
jgi:hypothetical protein